MPPRKLPPIEERVNPELRARLAQLEHASGRVAVADYNKLVDERNRMAGVLLKIASQTVQFAPPLHLLKPDRRRLYEWIAAPLGIAIPAEEEPAEEHQ